MSPQNCSQKNMIKEICLLVYLLAVFNFPSKTKTTKMLWSCTMYTRCKEGRVRHYKITPKSSKWYGQFALFSYNSLLHFISPLSFPFCVCHIGYWEVSSFGSISTMTVQGWGGIAYEPCHHLTPMSWKHFLPHFWPVSRGFIKSRVLSKWLNVRGQWCCLAGLNI